MVFHRDGVGIDATLERLGGLADRVVVVVPPGCDWRPAAGTAIACVEMRDAHAAIEHEHLAIEPASWVLLLEAGEVVGETLAAEIREKVAAVEAIGFAAWRSIEFAGTRVRDPRCGRRVCRLAPAARIGAIESPTLGGLAVDVRVRMLAHEVRHEGDPSLEALLRRFNDETSKRSHHLAGGGTPSLVWAAAKLLAHLFGSLLAAGSANRRVRRLGAAYDLVTVLKRVDAARGSKAFERLEPPRATSGPPLPVTVVVPIRNEARNLSHCLPRLARFERVLVVDSGSDDESLEIARRFGAETVEFRWDGRFPKKRNWVLRSVPIESPWVLFLDADEFVSEGFVEELSRVLPSTSHAGFWLSFRSHFMGRLLRHGDRFSKLALIRRGAGEYERIDEERWSRLDMEVHEHPVLDGSEGRIRSPIDHHDLKRLHAYLDRHNEYSSWEARRATRLAGDRAALDRLTGRQRAKYRHLTSPSLASAYFLASYLLKGGWLDGAAGFGFAFLKWLYFSEIRLKILEARRASTGPAPRMGE